MKLGGTVRSRDGGAGWNSGRQRGESRHQIGLVHPHLIQCVIIWCAVWGPPPAALQLWPELSVLLFMDTNVIATISPGCAFPAQTLYLILRTDTLIITRLGVHFVSGAISSQIRHLLRGGEQPRSPLTIL